MENLQKLKEIYLEFDSFRYPEIPDRCRAFPTYFKKIKTTNGLTKCIIAYLRLNGWMAERINNTGKILDNRKIFNDAAGFKRQIGNIEFVKGSGTKGTPDISATINGKAVKFEVKNIYTKDRISKEQLDYKTATDISGGDVFFVTSFEHFIKIFEDNFTKNPRYLEFWQFIKDNKNIKI